MCGGIFAEGHAPTNRATATFSHVYPACISRTPNHLRDIRRPLLDKDGLTRFDEPKCPFSAYGENNMLRSTMRIVTIVCCAVAVSSLASVCVAQCSSCAATTVAPAYTTYMAPTYTTYMAPNYAYMPTPVYQATYRPAYVAYAPVYQSYAVTTYRPLFGWSYTTRMVPYTAYQPVYAPAASVAYYGCSTCPTYTSECSSCSSCGTVSYASPTSGCTSCAATASPTVVSPAPVSSGNQATPPRTFEEKSQKPVAEPDVKPIPQTEMKFNSMPSPLLPDPRDRTVNTSAVRMPVRVALTASTNQAAPVQDNDGWRPARD